MATHIQEHYETSLKAIDTGFCLKKQGMQVTLPVSALFKIHYDGEKGEQCTVIGNFNYVRFYLTIAGYKVNESMKG